MPRIHDYMRDCVIYLYPTEGDAAAPDGGDRIGGSGFLVGVPFPTHPGMFATFAVTNEHVYKQAPVVRLNRFDGTPAIAALRPEHWIPHPDGDDVAIAPISGLDQSQHQIRTIPTRMFLTKEKLKELDYGIGDEVFFIGRFTRQETTALNAPSLRFGNISQTTGFIYQEPRQFNQESFLVEARSISGYSGSPVFVHMPAMSARPNPEQPTDMKIVPFPGNGPWLLGIDWGHILDHEQVVDAAGRPLNPSRFVYSNTGMMGVVPSWKLLEMFDIPKVVDLIKRSDEVLTQMKKTPPAKTSLDIAGRDPAIELRDVDEAFEKTVKTMLASPPSPRLKGSGAKRTHAKRGKSK